MAVILNMYGLLLFFSALGVGFSLHHDQGCTNSQREKLLLGNYVRGCHVIGFPGFHMPELGDGCINTKTESAISKTLLLSSLSIFNKKHV